MSYMKRHYHATVISVRDRNGDVLYPVDPAPFYRCEDRPRRIPVGHPMAERVIAPPLWDRHYQITPPPPINGELAARVCAAIAWAGMVVIVLGVVRLVCWL